MGIKATIKKERTKLGNIITVIWNIIVAIDAAWRLIFGILSIVDDVDNFSKVGLRIVLIKILVILIRLVFAAFLILLPIIIRKLEATICRRCSLTIFEDRVEGTYGRFSTKSLSLPIEQLSAVSISNGFFDKIRSGETVTLNTASGAIKFHFVHNAAEICAKALEVINKYKENLRSISDSAAPAAAPVVGTADELLKYKQLLDSGVITQEEFDAKKKQILGL